MLRRTDHSGVTAETLRPNGVRERHKASTPTRVAYIMSRFPKLTETFVLFEMLAVEKQGAEIEVFPLLRARNSSAHPEAAGIVSKVKELLRRPESTAVMHPEAKRFVDRAHFVPFLNREIVFDQLYFLFRRPWIYLSVLWTLIRANWGSANFLLGGLALFPKCVHFARQMQKRDVTHVHAHFANHPAAAAMIISRLTDIPYSFTGHGSDLQVDQHMLREKVQYAKQVVAISDDNRRLIESVCGAEAARRVSIIHCGVDTEVFESTPRTEQQSDSLRIVSVGTLYEVKGHTHLIEACRMLKQLGVNFHLYLVGDGPLREDLQCQTIDADLSDYVSFLGRCTRDQIAAVLRESDVLVAPSIPAADGRREGIPVVLMEAMASGLPVVASRISGIPELVTDEINGLLVPAADPIALANAMSQLAHDPVMRSRLGRNARATVEGEFDLHKNARRLMEIFSASEVST